MVNVQNSGSSL